MSKTYTTFNAAPGEGDPSPWGRIEYINHTAVVGCLFVGTAGWYIDTQRDDLDPWAQGGFWVARELLTKIPTAWRAFGAAWSHGFGEQWYEEDCAAIAVAAYILGDKKALNLLPVVERRATFWTRASRDEDLAAVLEPWAQEVKP
jgi:hypothetical protein